MNTTSRYRVIFCGQAYVRQDRKASASNVIEMSEISQRHTKASSGRPERPSRKRLFRQNNKENGFSPVDSLSVGALANDAEHHLYTCGQSSGASPMCFVLSPHPLLDDTKILVRDHMIFPAEQR